MSRYPALTSRYWWPSCRLCSAVARTATRSTSGSRWPCPPGWYPRSICGTILSWLAGRLAAVMPGHAPDPAAFPAGRFATARITWRTQIGQKPGYHLLDLRPAGFALPVLSFPVDELLARGPLQQWGFEHLGERDPSQPLPLSDRLVVSLHAGPADVDVFDVGVGVSEVGQLKPTALTPMTGMKGAATRPAWADAAAAQHGCYMLLATTQNATKAAPSDLLLSSWCVITRIIGVAPAMDRSTAVTR